MADEPNLPDDLDWHEFPEGEGPRVMTGISTACNEEKHEECPGHGEHEGQQIFCVCSCHKVESAA
jgi:hypothetical protein